MKVETVKVETRPDVVIRLSPTEADRLRKALYHSGQWKSQHGIPTPGIGDDGRRLGVVLHNLGYGV